MFKQEKFKIPVQVMQAEKRGDQYYQVRLNTPYGPCGGFVGQHVYAGALKLKEESEGEGIMECSFASETVARGQYTNDYFKVEILNLDPVKKPAGREPVASGGTASR